MPLELLESEPELLAWPQRSVVLTDWLTVVALKFLSAKFGSTDLSLPPGATCVLIPGTSAPFDKWVCGAPEVRIHLAPPSSLRLMHSSWMTAKSARVGDVMSG
jgi:hypothetical protein